MPRPGADHVGATVYWPTSVGDQLDRGERLAVATGVRLFLSVPAEQLHDLDHVARMIGRRLRLRSDRGRVDGVIVEDYGSGPSVWLTFLLADGRTVLVEVRWDAGQYGITRHLRRRRQRRLGGRPARSGHADLVAASGTACVQGRHRSRSRSARARERRARAGRVTRGSPDDGPGEPGEREPEPRRAERCGA
jgi:hypothetical protein